MKPRTCVVFGVNTLIKPNTWPQQTSRVDAFGGGHVVTQFASQLSASAATAAAEAAAGAAAITTASAVGGCATAGKDHKQNAIMLDMTPKPAENRTDGKDGRTATEERTIAPTIMAGNAHTGAFKYVGVPTYCSCTQIHICMYCICRMANGYKHPDIGLIKQ